MLPDQRCARLSWPISCPEVSPTPCDNSQSPRISFPTRVRDLSGANVTAGASVRIACTAWNLGDRTLVPRALFAVRPVMALSSTPSASK